MISSVDVYVLTISMIVAVVVAMKALGHLISPSCPQPLFQSEGKRKAIDMKIYMYFLSSRKFNWWFALSLVLKTRGFGARKWPIKNCSTTTLDFETTAKSASLSHRLRIAVNSLDIWAILSWQLSNMGNTSWSLWWITEWIGANQKR